MRDDIVIAARRLGKRYTLARGARRHDTLRDLVAHQFQSLVRDRRVPRPERSRFWALREVSFDIRRGENVGIIGLNGAGKSTLLKILSRITTPTTGSARLRGRVGALLEVGTGFHGELTGRENVYLYGAILGMTRAEMDRKFGAIVEFAEIGELIDMPLKRYSSGMHVRLAFSVAAHMDPEILILDEVLAVGDVTFQRKCIALATELRRRDATILFVSHNMFSIKMMCSRVIYLRKGELVFDGPIDDGVKLYDEDSRLGTLPWSDGQPQMWPLVVTDCALIGASGDEKTVFDHGERMTIRLAYKARQPISRPNFIVAFIRSDGVAVCNYSTEADGFDTGEVEGQGVISLRAPPLRLVAEHYTVHVIVRESGFQRVLCSQIGGTFHVRHDLFDLHFGVFHEEATWCPAGTAPAADLSVTAVAGA